LGAREGGKKYLKKGKKNEEKDIFVLNKKLWAILDFFRPVTYPINLKKVFFQQKILYITIH